MECHSANGPSAGTGLPKLQPMPFVQGNLKIKERLGHGATAVVYKALLDQQKVAVKVYKPECVDVCGTEARHLAHYTHSNIIKAIGITSTDNTPSLVMEYMDAGSLFRLISKQMASPHSKVYSDSDALTWLSQIASAIAFLHQNHNPVVHRDIKQENILLKKENDKLVAKLVDFSLTTALTVDKLSSGSVHVSSSSMRTSFDDTATASDTTIPAAAYPHPNSHSYSHSWSSQSTTNAAPFSGANTVLSSEAILSHRGTVGTASSVVTSGDVLSDRNTMRIGSQGIDAHNGLIPRTSIGASGNAPITGEWTMNGSNAASRTQPRQPASQPCAVPMMRSPGGDRALSNGSSISAFAAGNASVNTNMNASMKTNNPRLPSSPEVSAGKVQGQGAGPTAAAAGARAPYDDWWRVGMSESRVAGGSSVHSGLSRVSAATTFNLTGQTGSYAYMAPEVFNNAPYNEKSDVFSFAIVMYELLGRTLVIYTQTREGTEKEMEAYAQGVAQGFRPGPSKRLNDAAWKLIQQCWHEDPEQRPTMKEVCESLTALRIVLMDKAEGETGSGRLFRTGSGKLGGAGGASMKRLFQGNGLTKLW